ncbi:hypothetical protein PCANC_26887 [Puccinia coronata f. sp. avenae]|uniref:Uncharacterized protein n=1 Tax=Puccinia coronata f. sp. avenae TaxID=200324 RepID=A0A2N5RW76_9BASI|nr:hypothetical protein PCANC_26887 [Puccinia coronata f. sp. avenae]
MTSFLTTRKKNLVKERADLSTRAARHRKIYKLLYAARAHDSEMRELSNLIQAQRQEANDNLSASKHGKPKQYNLNIEKLKQNKINGGKPTDPLMKLIIMARNKLENLGPVSKAYRIRQKEEQTLFVEILVVLSRDPNYSEDALHAIDTVIKTLKLRKDPQAQPKLMRYLKAAHYVMTTEEKSLDSPTVLRQISETGKNLVKHLANQKLEDWLDNFQRQTNPQVHEIYQNMMITDNYSGAEIFDRILQWSSETMHPLLGHNKAVVGHLFALETLHLLSSKKPEGLGGHNPAIEELISAGNAWRIAVPGKQPVHEFIELTTESALKRQISTITDDEIRAVITQHKAKSTPPKDDETPKTGEILF